MLLFLHWHPARARCTSTVSAHHTAALRQTNVSVWLNGRAPDYGSGRLQVRVLPRMHFSSRQAARDNALTRSENHATRPLSRTPCGPRDRKAQTAGLELARAEPSGFRVHPLDRLGTSAVHERPLGVALALRIPNPTTAVHFHLRSNLHPSASMEWRWAMPGHLAT